MNPAVVKELANKYSKFQLDEAIQAFEQTLENPLEVHGQDDGEKLSNLLVAAFVRERMDKGIAINEALREYSTRVRSMIGGPKKG